MKIAYCAIVFLIFNTSTFCQDFQEQFAKGNEAYSQNDYSKAISHYSEIVKGGMASSELYYNLANAHKENNQLGQAILYYEKAIKLSPNNNNIKTNLEISREEVDSDIIEIPDFLPVRIWRAFSSLLSPLIWIIVQTLLGLLLLYSVYSFFKTQIPKSRSVKIFMLSLLALFIVIPAGHTAHKLISSLDYGVVMSQSDLKDAPDDRSENIEPLSEGVKVKIIDQVDDWYKVSLMNKEIGWLEKNKLELI